MIYPPHQHHHQWQRGFWKDVQIVWNGQHDVWVLTLWRTRGHSRPHLQVPSVSRYDFTCSRQDSTDPLGLQTHTHQIITITVKTAVYENNVRPFLQITVCVWRSTWHAPDEDSFVLVTDQERSSLADVSDASNSNTWCWSPDVVLQWCAWTLLRLGPNHNTS